MDIQLRQRLLAAIVILALVVIFVPMLFRKHAQDQISSITSFPTEPAQPNVANPNSTTLSESTLSPAQEPAQETPAETAQSTAMPESTTTMPAQPVSMPVTQTTPAQPPATMPMRTLTPAKPITSTSATVQAVSTNAATIKTTVVKPAISVTTPPMKQLTPAVVKPTQPTIKPSQPQTISIQPVSMNDEASVPHRLQLHVRASDLNSNNVLPEVEAAQAVRLQTASDNNQAFVVQLGSFANQQNAKTLVAKLQKAGFSAFIHTVRNDHLVSYRAYVGPMVQKDQANAMKMALAKQMHLNSLIVPFDATSLH